MTVDTAPVTEAAARATGPAASAGRTPRTKPRAPRITGPSQSDAGASCDAGVVIERPRNGAMPAMNPAAPRHMLAPTASAMRMPLQTPGSADMRTLS